MPDVGPGTVARAVIGIPGLGQDREGTVGLGSEGPGSGGIAQRGRGACLDHQSARLRFTLATARELGAGGKGRLFGGGWIASCASAQRSSAPEISLGVPDLRARSSAVPQAESPSRWETERLALQSII